jgi:hypothetical protein
MLQLFHLDVAKVDLHVAYILFQLFLYVYYKCSHLDFIMFAMAIYMFSSFLVFCKYFSYFRRMLQVFYLNVAKVDRMLHMCEWDPLAAAACCSCWDTAKLANGPHLQSSGAGDIWATRALRGHA